ncbi:MAG: NAD(P)/FAD-dependent oxidoreductase [Betaproteobacteria bacterium]|nr:NAD(P)/FAD-dependent oxidoreductase [Betaproteobacteria bacterium]
MPHPSGALPSGLEALRERVNFDLECLNYPARPWVRTEPGDEDVLDCAIVGGGQYGQSLAFGLLRERVQRVVVFDANPPGLAGPWLTFARMIMLRTPKDLTGPDMGIGSLSFRAWYEAQHGRDGWEKLFRISRPDWQGYLNWHRDVTGIDVRPERRVTRVTPVSANRFELEVQCADGTIERFRSRTVVLATGAEGSGARVKPPIFDGLPKSLHAHTNDLIDFTALRGARIGILGAGASSFDNASAALEAGARSAELCFRRPQLPLANPRRWMEFAGYLAHYPELPDAERWHYMKRLYDISQPPPEPTFKKATSLPGFRLRPGTPWLSVREKNGAVAVETPQGSLEFDFVIAGTGITVDLSQRQELASVTPHIALWGDRFTPAADQEDTRLARFPYLDRFGAFTEKVPGTAPWASRIFAIFRGATLSLGPSSASNSNIRYTAPRIVSGITRALFLEGAEATRTEFDSQSHHELAPDTVSAVVAK